MANSKAVKAVLGQTIELNVICRSPHVLVYRLWAQEPGSAWKILKTGRTDDNVPDFLSVGPFPASTKIAYLLRFGGNPRTQFLGILTVSQGSEVVEGGTFVEPGLADEDGLAQVVRQFNVV